MIRCKLIAPTQLLLDHPMQSPVAEEEYFVVGVRAYQALIDKNTSDAATGGFALGVLLCTLVAMLAYFTTR